MFLDSNHPGREETECQLKDGQDKRPFIGNWAQHLITARTWKGKSKDVKSSTILEALKIRILILSLLELNTELMRRTDVSWRYREEKYPYMQFRTVSRRYDVT